MNDHSQFSVISAQRMPVILISDFDSPRAIPHNLDFAWILPLNLHWLRGWGLLYQESASQAQGILEPRFPGFFCRETVTSQVRRGEQGQADAVCTAGEEPALPGITCSSWFWASCPEPPSEFTLGTCVSFQPRTW